MTTTLCHYCEFDTTGDKWHHCPFIGIPELEKRVVDAALYALVGSGSITAQCRSDAAVLVLHWANNQTPTEGAYSDGFSSTEIDAKTEEAYRYFEFGGEDYPPERREPEPQWAIWDDPSPSPAPEDSE